MLAMEEKRLDQLKRFLENRQTELKQLCREPDAQKKIDLIAAGILRKNYKFVQRYEQTETHARELAERMNRAREQLEALKLRLSLDKPSTRYKLTTSATSSNDSAATIIADAILNEPKAAQLVARSSDNNLAMDKTWDLMSDLDKDELLHRRVLRNL